MRLSKLQKKEIKDFKKKLIQEEIQKQLLINKKTDFGLLEELIQKVNDNPNLKIKITISDGSVIEINTFKPQKKSRDLIEEFSQIDI